MPLLVNLNELQGHKLTLDGDLPVAELDLPPDELVHYTRPLAYELTVELLGDVLLVQGTGELPLELECARCLKRFPHTLTLDNWSAHFPLSGPEKVSAPGDLVDLTPPLREDILLALPQRPLCGNECGGLQAAPPGNENKRAAGQPEPDSGAWAELDKLKF